MWAFSSCGEQGILFVAVRRLLVAVASLCRRAQALGAQASVVVARSLSSYGSLALERRLSSCGAQDQLLRGMWDLPGPVLEPVCPALAGGPFFFFNINLLIYLFLAALGLCCCVRAFSNCTERGLLFTAVHGLVVAVGSLVAEHGL